jgi:MFS family permease
VFGVRLGTVIFACFILLGQVLLSIGGFLNCLWFMDIARFIFGVGGESLNMALNTYTVSWFKGKELNMVFGFQLSIARVGSTVNFLVMEPLFHYIKNNFEEYSALGWTLLIACSFTVMSFFCSLLLGFMDRRREKAMQTNAPPCGNSSETEKVKFSDVKNFPATFWFLCICTMAYYGSIFPFVSLAQGFFKNKFDFDETEANFITGKS